MWFLVQQLLPSISACFGRSTSFALSWWPLRIFFATIIFFLFPWDQSYLLIVPFTGHTQLCLLFTFPLWDQLFFIILAILIYSLVSFLLWQSLLCFYIKELSRRLIILNGCISLTASLQALFFQHASFLRGWPLLMDQLFHQRLHFGPCGIRQEESHTHRGQICSCPGGGWERGGWEFGVVRCKLLNRGWINSKVLLYGTGDDIQYPGINHTGKDSLYSGPPRSINRLGCPRKFIFREKI